jgi:hypothetical protein
MLNPSDAATEFLSRLSPDQQAVIHRWEDRMDHVLAHLLNLAQEGIVLLCSSGSAMQTNDDPERAEELVQQFEGVQDIFVGQLEHLIELVKDIPTLGSRDPGYTNLGDTLVAKRNVTVRDFLGDDLIGNINPEEIIFAAGEPVVVEEIDNDGDAEWPLRVTRLDGSPIWTSAEWFV